MSDKNGNLEVVSKGINQLGSIKLDAGLVHVITGFQKMITDIEHEKTRREEIIANREVMLRQVEAFREVALTYLEKSFAERGAQFEKLFNALDKAIDSGDSSQTAAVAHAISEISKNGPLKDLISLAHTQKALGDPQKTWEL